MADISVLFGGITGDGINEAGVTISRLFNRLGYHIYMYYDYPSLVKGGHSFAIIRASDRKIGAYSDKVDFVLALSQDTIDLHKNRWTDDTIVIYDLDKVNMHDDRTKSSIGLPLSTILQGEGDVSVMQNMCIIGCLGKVAGIEWSIYEDMLQKHTPGMMLEQYLKIARRGYDAAEKHGVVEKLDKPSLPVITGNQAISLGLIKAGLKTYISYPMTPTSSILEFLAGSAQELGLQVVTPESEIAVMIMALGYAYMGVKTAVGTSGGGFSLMVEGLGLAGQAELPVVVVMGQRAGPSTGMPTYTSQADLHFIISASQGEFPRFIVAPGDAEEAYYWSGIALNKAWKYQVPAFILSDKTLCLGLFSFDSSSSDDIKDEAPVLWDGIGNYKRYQHTATGVSPLAFPPLKGQVIKTNSYVHDERGITSEDPGIAKEVTDKRLLKESSLAKELENYQTVKVYGKGKTALLCWGSNKGVCIETAQKLGMRAIQVLVLSPFPAKAMASAVEGVERIISVECNATGQMATLLQQYGYRIDDRILKYDGRPFSLEELENDLKKVIA
jgi:2-oxoglutarate ferredoxin oxidoreductase subunit alpha